MTTSMVMEMNLGENGGRKQSVNGGGGGGGRRKSKGSELTQKKNKQPQRGMGVEQLERLRLQERWKKMTELPSLHPLPLPNSFSSSVAFPTSSSCNTVANGGGVHFRPATAPPGMLLTGIGNGCGMLHGSNLFLPDQVADPSVIGSGHGGFRFENSKELASIPNYIKCASDGCGICHKKKRINGGSNACLVNTFRNFCGNNTVGEMIDAGKTRRCSGQVTEVMSVHRNGGGSLTEYEFFPGKGGGAEDYKELMRMGSTTWCGSTSVGGGMIGLRRCEGSCVTAITGSEEGSVSSIDLSLKLSY
ncbi:hypothetical protein L6452_28669 [Arctium lappa]|uniref:Uncharacterized protein n=1 Tax=Arctium lappa TaxID=4217 RepID=A0ACB8ZZX2_ARCLA|nr:hypothetical protein L6452_28669 [Arctium lappa]